MESQRPTDRLNYSGDLNPIIDRLSDAYNIGSPSGFSVVEIGYEDCNVAIEAGDKKYFAKMFSKDRSEDEIARYTAIMGEVVEAGVNHPELFKTKQGDLVYHDSGISLVLMPYINGQTFFDLNRAPDATERQAIIEQAVKVNRIDYKPSYLFDGWAIPSIQTSYDRVQQFMSPKDQDMVKQVIAQYTSIPIDNLPRAFVHGDFTKANVMKGDDGRFYILDFSVSNWYPRIQELAVIAANLLHDEGKTPLAGRCELVATEYSRLNTLTDDERKYLYPYALAGVAMELLGAHVEKYINKNDGEETEYWFTLGREGLKQALEN